ncbi:MAG: hypothetical protein P8J87_13465 [Verrucomicrobiales bacterium]|nr:hypothetical protein [Verrucomicrobiales bacterium]
MRLFRNWIEMQNGELGLAEMSEPKKRSWGRMKVVFFGLAAAMVVSSPVDAQQQQQGFCATVKVAILQELTLERIGFEATLEITNNDGQVPITDFLAELTFEDPELTTPDSPNDASDLFFVRQPILTDVNRVDGTGIIGPTKKAVAKWFIIPKIGTGGTDPFGKKYFVGCRMGGKLNGEEIGEEILFAIPEEITVKPEPQLCIRYFQPRDVQGDDPFTPEVESPIPFTLGVLVGNEGYGVAKNLKINSQQPKIVENKQGLLLVARLLGARVQDSPLDETSLLVDLGDINPAETKKGAWDMITTLSGEFIEFKASYTHAAELGGVETSVINKIEAHLIAAEVLNDQPGRDTILDFLADVDRDANLIPETLFESQGNVVPVNYLRQVTVAGTAAANDVQLTLDADFENWGYIRVDDPGQAKLGIARVTRSDGKVLTPQNYWTNVRYEKGTNNRLAWLNVLDYVANGQTYVYSVEYSAAPVDVTAPETRLRFAGTHTTEAGIDYISPETQMYFTSEDDSPVSILYKIDGGAFVPGLPFTIPTPGVYTVTYYAEDNRGNVEVENVATVSVSGAGPVIAGYSVSVGNLFLPGSVDVVSVRPGEAALDISVGPNPLDVDALVDVFRGVVAWPRLSGVPPSPTPDPTAMLTVSGDHVDFYKYRINGGGWTPDQAVAEVIDLAGLSGAVQIEILGRSASGDYLPDAEALAASWVVDGAAPLLTVSGVPATPTRATGVALQLGGDAGLTDYRWSLDDSYYRPEAPIGDVLNLSGLLDGEHVLRIIGKRAGVWQDEAEATVIRWTQSGGYGFDYSSLQLVRTTPYDSVQGQSLTNLWDGKNGSGVAQLPGVYLVRLTLEDELGRKTYQSRLVSVESLVASGTELSTAADGGESPDAGGQFAVWQERSAGIWNIKMKDLQSTALATFVTAEVLNQENPRTDGSYVVWQARQANGSTDIFYADLRLATPVAVRVTDSLDRHEVNPVIEWPWVVFQQKDVSNENDIWQLEAVNLETMVVSAVDSSTQDQLVPSIHAGRVAWEDRRDVGPGEVYFKDLETGEFRRLTNEPAGQTNPSIHGHRVVWQDNRHGQVELYGFDLRKGVEERLTDTAHNETDAAVQGDWVLFLEDSLGANQTNLAMLDLHSGEVVPVTRSEEAKTTGAFGDGYVLWGEGAAGSRAVLSSFLPSLQAVARNHNTVVVTDTMVGEFPTAFALLEEWNVDAGVGSVTRYVGFGAAPVTETATWNGASGAGTDFPLVAGDFLWIKFDGAKVLELGDASAGAVDIASGKQALSYGAFPVGYSAFDFIDAVGEANIGKLRMLDAHRGEWLEVEMKDGIRYGSNFAIPRVAALLVDMNNSVNGWKP